jgi:hypothetical protein
MERDSPRLNPPPRLAAPRLTDAPRLRSPPPPRCCANAYGATPTRTATRPVASRAFERVITTPGREWRKDPANALDWFTAAFTGKDECFAQMSVACG